MTISTTNNTVTAVGDNSTVAFSFPYLTFQESHLTITIDGVATAFWSAATYGSASGVTVTFDTAPALSASIIIQRIVPYTQDTDLENFDGNPADVTEKQFDLLAMADQQLSEAGERAILVPIDEELATNEILGTIDATSRALVITTSGVATALLSSVSSTLDTVLTSLASGDYLRYDGAAWVNDTTAETLTALGAQPLDTELTALASLTSAANKIPMFSGSGTASVIDLLDEDTLVSDSATAVPTQQSVKAYVDTEITAGATDTQQLAKAWVNFNGTGTVAIRDSYNVSSITDHGTGDYTVNLTSSMTDTNYCVISAHDQAGAGGAGWGTRSYNFAVGSFRLNTGVDGSTSSALGDSDYVAATVYGDLA